MSLIQEALRRQQEESGGGLPAEAQRQAIQPPPRPGAEKSAAPPPPPPPPSLVPLEDADKGAEPGQPPPAPGEGKESSRAWPALVGVLIVMLLLIGGGIWLIYFAFSQWSSRELIDPDRAGGPALTEAAPAETPPVVETATTEAPVTPPVTTPPEANPPAQTPAQQVAAQSPPPEPESDKPVKWPELALTGVIGQGGSGSAIINSEIVAVNDTIDGVLVVSIDRQGVTLECGGESKYLKVGTSTR